MVTAAASAGASADAGRGVCESVSSSHSGTRWECTVTSLGGWPSCDPVTIRWTHMIPPCTGWHRQPSLAAAKRTCSLPTPGTPGPLPARPVGGHAHLAAARDDCRRATCSGVTPQSLSFVVFFPAHWGGINAAGRPRPRPHLQFGLPAARTPARARRFCPCRQGRYILQIYPSLGTLCDNDTTSIKVCRHVASCSPVIGPCPWRPPASVPLSHFIREQENIDCALWHSGYHGRGGGSHARAPPPLRWGSPLW